MTIPTTAMAFAVAVAVALAGAATPTAAADPAIVVAADDTRTHAVASRNSVAVSSWYTRLPDQGHAIWLQLGLGPSRFKLPFRGASMGELDRWTARLRVGRLWPDDAMTDAVWSPLTIAAQRISAYDTLSVLPLIHLQTGIEIAVSTPWLSDPELDPELAHGDAWSADTELARNGWSLRPASWHVRADALMCRAIHLEAGIGPELFRSTADPDRGLDYGLRWNASLGFSLACPRDSAFSRWVAGRLTVSAQYRARALLYNRDDDASYDDQTAVALMYQYRGYAIAGFATLDGHLWGIRVSVEAGGPKR
jgi:hypothetical protein